MSACTLRPALLEDAAEVARLATQLGYPADAAQMRPRLQGVLSDPRQHVFVADAGDGSLLGWAALQQRLSLEGGEQAELVGLVVDARVRRGGVGLALLLQVEQRARELGYGELLVRSNTARLESHPFYLKHGYRRAKSQHVYLKAL